MLTRLPQGQKSLPSATPANPSTGRLDRLPSILITISPYLLGLFLVKPPDSKTEGLEYLLKFTVFGFFIITLHLIRYIITAITPGNPQPGTTGKRDWIKIPVIILSGSLMVFISGYLKYKFNYSDEIFQLSILVLSAFFIYQGLKLKGYDLWSALFKFIYLTAAGFLGVAVLSGIKWYIPLIFSSSLAGFIVSLDLYKFSCRQVFFSEENGSAFSGRLAFLNKVSDITVTLTFLFFGYVITGLAALLGLLPKRFILLYLIALVFFKYFERKYNQSISCARSNSADQAAQLNAFKRDCEILSLLYCASVIILAL